MIGQNRLWALKLALCLAVAVCAVPAFAQNTTSAIGGRIIGADGKPVGGAQITIIHKDSGSINNSVTDGDGRYLARGLRVGGPYTVTITKDGMTEKREGIYLALAETTALDAKLGAKVQAVETIVVIGQAGGSDKFSNTAMGAGTSISRADLDAFASIQRNLQDYARLDPRLSQTDKERGEASVAGQNSRYNSITIDGVAINDTFGLEANGLPTLKQPISIDAIQSVQVNVSNYDVTQKGYTGANINAVTKSGTNEFKGSVSYVTRDDKYVGQRYSKATNTYTDAPKFEESTVGFTLGGPIIKDKLFFFAAYEELKSTRNAPDFGPIGSSASNVIGITPTAIAGAQSIASTSYATNIGTSVIAPGTKLSAKDTLLKLDWNINAYHRANIRYSKTDQIEPLFPNFFSTPSTALSLSSQWYKQVKTIETTVGQWFADWSPNFSTEVKISQRDYQSEPKNNSKLPAITLGFTGALPPGTPSSVLGGTRNLVFGTERSRHFNVLDTKTLDGFFGGNWALGAHEVKFSADYSKNKVFNAFLQDVNGNYTFNCQNSSVTYTYSFGAITCNTATAAQIEAAVLENFSRGRPSSYQVQVPLAGTTLDDAIARFSIINKGLAAQDTWSVNPQLTFMYGFRYDLQSVNEKPLFNAAAAAPLVAGNPVGAVRQSGGFGRDNSVTVDGIGLFQPRVGFNYTFDSARPTQLRGGVGLFQGAAATVWLSNPFSNTGVATRIVGCGGAFAACPATGGIFSADPGAQPTSFAGAAPAANVDFLEKGLGQPSIWKANLAFEHQLPWYGVVFGAEYLATKTESGIYYQHLNLGAPTRIGTDGRELYYTANAYNPACWTAGGSRLTTGACAGGRARALSNPNFNNVLLAAKTNEGAGDLVTVSLSRPLARDWGWSLAYTYTRGTEVSGLTSSVSNSNWAARSIFNPNENSAANSVYLVKDRVNGTLNWQHSFFSGFKTQVGLFYEGRSGKPYSWTYINDMNGDAQGGNDLMYIPRAPGSGEVVFLGDTPTSRANEDAFWKIVNANPALREAAGGVVKRNSSFSPWVNSIDMRLSQEVPSFFKGHKAVFIFDILNVGNLLNKRWGRIDEIGFQSGGGQPRSFVNFVGIDPSGRYIYSVGNPGDFTTRQQRGESQWALQATFRYEF